MGTTKKTNGKIKGTKRGAAMIPPDDDDVPTSWLSRLEVSRMLGVTTTTVRNKDDELSPKYRNSRAYYDPEVVKAYAQKPEMRAYVERAPNPIAVDQSRAPSSEPADDADDDDEDDDESDDDEDVDEEDDGEDDDEEDGDEGEDDEPARSRGSYRGLARRGLRGRVEEDPYEGWFTIGQVAAKMRVHPQTIKSRVKSGELRPVYKGKRAYFDPEEIDAITPQSLNEIASAELLGNCNTIIKEQQSHIRQMLDACVGGAMTLVKVFGEEVTLQRGRVRELEKEISEGRKLIDKAETEEVQRSLLVAEHNEKLVTREKLLSMVQTNVPSIISMIAAKVAPGTPAAGEAQARTIASIVDSLTPEQIQQIAPLLTREQGMAIMGVKHAIEREKQALASVSPEPRAPSPERPEAIGVGAD